MMLHCVTTYQKDNNSLERQAGEGLFTENNMTAQSNFEGLHLNSAQDF